MSEDLIAEVVTIQGHGGDWIPAYVARPLGPGPYPSVVVLHHRDGWDKSSKEVARRLAWEGIACVMPHLHHREAPGQPSAVAAEVALKAGGIPDDRCVGDTAGAYEYLRHQPWASERIGVLGYCSGGRQAFLAATSIPFDTVVMCYSPRVNAKGDDITPLSPVAPLSLAAGIQGTVLGIFGQEDPRPSPADVAEIGAELTRLGKEHTFRTFENAGHAFMANDRTNYRVEAANAAWVEKLAWLRSQLGTTHADD